ncbi:predicted protein [Lichtheimia corymbifera JMRC:FSU:9682]|uniref:Transmembrane protein n=2 Tax=Lichtheimia corymbifera JMRC:FSU:9682 TaxID=1263082 RepID=A0A068S7S5_9FUNG|nr:predicted protein [Lichtheimia corymbifera JMRC:FSU:9682]
MGARQHTWAPTSYHYLDHRRRSSSVSLSTTSSSSSTSTTHTTTASSGKRFRRRCTYPISYQRKAISPRICYFARPVTISSSSSSENTMQQLSIEIPATYLSSSSPPCLSPIPVFHTQSLLFLFGFLFFPCWWVGAFLLRKQPQQQSSLLPTKEGYQAQYNLISVHPSLLANGRVSSRMLWVPQQQHYSSNSTLLRVVSTTLPDIPGSRMSWARRLEQEYEMFQKWNRYMSFASIVLILIIIAMLAWYHDGVVYGRWRPLPH